MDTDEAERLLRAAVIMEEWRDARLVMVGQERINFCARRRQWLDRVIALIGERPEVPCQTKIRKRALHLTRADWKMLREFGIR